jgi:oxygen-independent coproporphyrinogen-3 oxidase
MSLSLYIHIPFCKSKCFYCSFVSFAKQEALITPYLAALEKEVTLYKDKSISTVYIGGGTPSCLSIDQLKKLFSVIRSHFNILPDAEVTLEANPAIFDLEKAQIFSEGGINRVSLGVQSLNDENLEWLGRPHRQEEAVASVGILRKAGFENINLDLIYSLPHQGKKEIEEDARRLMALDSEHVSLYTLTIAEGSELYKRRMGAVVPERQAQHYRFVVELFKKEGWRHYEVSNFAKKGFECRHNLNYWQGGDYIGLGVAAHSHIDGCRSWNVEDIASYIKRIEKEGSARSGEERLSSLERLMETLLIGLRMSEGVDIGKIESRFKIKLPPEKTAVINEFIHHGLLSQEGPCLKTTLSGMVVLDELCARLI